MTLFTHTASKRYLPGIKIALNYIEFIFVIIYFKKKDINPK